MSETAGFEDRPPDLYVSVAWNRELIDELRQAISAIDEPMTWESSDGLSVMTAAPVSFPEYPLDVPYGRLRQLSDFALRDIMPNWGIMRTTASWDESNVHHERIILTPDFATVASTVGSLAILEESPQGEFARNALFDDARRASEENSDLPATIRDYANLFNAVHDLRPIADKKMEEHLDYLRSMTPAEKRDYRSLMRDWHADPDPEQDKLRAPKYWAIMYFNQLWLVRASTPEAAVLDLEDHLERGIEPLEIFFVDPCEDVQAELSEKYPDGGVKRLIPYSRVEWPDDMNHLTDEQQAAFDNIDRLRTPSPDQS